MKIDELNLEKCFEHKLAIAAIVKDEAPYIEEWMDYHILAGVDYFYIYDNDSSDDLRGKLQRYIDAGKAEYHYYPGRYRQLEAYNDAIRKHKFDSKYIAFIDIDEFLLPLQQELILDIVEETMSMDDSTAGLAINCKSFGSSGHKAIPPMGGYWTTTCIAHRMATTGQTCLGNGMLMSKQ